VIEEQAASPEVLAVVQATLREVVDRPLGELPPETAIADLGIDSVSVADMVFRIEEALDIEMPTSDWITVRTLADFVDAVHRARQA
jgi:acyl carrier protein